MRYGFLIINIDDFNCVNDIHNIATLTTLTLML